VGATAPTQLWHRRQRAEGGELSDIIPRKEKGEEALRPQFFTIDTTACLFFFEKRQHVKVIVSRPQFFTIDTCTCARRTYIWRGSSTFPFASRIRSNRVGLVQVAGTAIVWIVCLCSAGRYGSIEMLWRTAKSIGFHSARHQISIVYSFLYREYCILRLSKPC
jgi:hypothetical protein